MKQLGSFLLIISAIFFQSCIYGDWNNGVSGDGIVTTEIINAEGFTGVHASSGIDVLISQGDFFVEVVADENLQQYIKVERIGSTLRIGSEKNIYRAESKVVNVTLPELKEIKISSAGDVVAENDFKCENLNIDISSAGDLSMGVDAEDISVSISSSGDCDLWGSANSLDARLSSAGDLNAFDLDADYVTIRVSSAGDASVTANKEIDMIASSAGNIYYKGDARVTRSTTSSAGSIVRR